MMKSGIKYIAFLLLVCSSALAQKNNNNAYHEQYRPQIHFSPPAHWMNDPNGMVYYKGVYHLFYQYYPNATVWGPMHWGHATSTDLVHWNNKPIALYPDSIGLIFSGSAVVDYQNTSGFGKNGKLPLVAIFTQHSQAGEKAGRADFENESIAYSNDEGKTWTKYQHNPVLKNPGIKDFRDPNVSWYVPGKKWIMTLATKDRITFYSSKDLKSWAKESEFGEHLGAHGGVWECPDLFPISSVDGKKLWVLISNIGSTGPAGGSAAQYFVGEFDGKEFKPLSTETHWLDYGPDNYAGVTWHNTANRQIFLGWMSNWQYATVVPTKAWRSANTVPRELKLVKVDTGYYVSSQPVKEMANLKKESVELHNLKVDGDINISKLIKRTDGQYQISLSTKQLKSFSVTLSNSKSEQLIAGYNEQENCWFVDRTKAGESGFIQDFAKRFTAVRIVTGKNADLTLVIDAASIELFADKGLSVMTAIYFPQKPLTNITISSKDLSINDLNYSGFKSIWH